MDGWDGCCCPSPCVSLTLELTTNKRDCVGTTEEPGSDGDDDDDDETTKEPESDGDDDDDDDGTHGM